MKRFAAFLSIALVTSPAYAADLGLVYAPEPEGYVASDWTGFYAGIFGGYAGGRFEYNGSSGAGFPWVGDGNGYLLGVQAGADYQINNFVLGGVVDVAWSDVDASTLGAGAIINSRLQYLGTARARAGVANESLLGYVHGGLAFGATDTNASFGGVPLNFHGNGRIGYTLGAGLEVKVTEQLSLFGEYAFTDLGNPIVFSNSAPPAFDLRETLRLQSVKVGLNYRF